MTRGVHPVLVSVAGLKVLALSVGTLTGPGVHILRDWPRNTCQGFAARLACSAGLNARAHIIAM